MNEDKAFDLVEDFCKSNAFFSDFSLENMDSFLHYLDVIHFKKDDVLMKQGEPASWTGFILSGKVDVVIDGVGKVAQMQANETVGEMSYFVADTKRTATIIGAEDGVMAAIPFDKIDHLYEDDPELAVKLQRALALSNFDKQQKANHRNTVSLIKEFEKKMDESSSMSSEGYNKDGRSGKDLDAVEEEDENEEQYEEVEEEDENGKKVVVRRKIVHKIEQGHVVPKKRSQRPPKQKLKSWDKAKRLLKQRKTIVGRGVIKREKKSFLGSSNTEVFYRNLVAKHKKSAAESEEASKELEAQVEKQKKKLVSEKVLRRRQNRLIKEMEAEITLLKERLLKYEPDDIDKTENVVSSNDSQEKGLALFRKNAKKVLFGVQASK